MNIGMGEILVLLVNGILVIGIPVVIILAVLVLLRRLKNLESRIQKLEADKDPNRNINFQDK